MQVYISKWINDANIDEYEILVRRYPRLVGTYIIWT